MRSFTFLNSISSGFVTANALLIFLIATRAAWKQYVKIIKYQYPLPRTEIESNSVSGVQYLENYRVKLRQ